MANLRGSATDEPPPPETRHKAPLSPGKFAAILPEPMARPLLWMSSEQGRAMILLTSVLVATDFSAPSEAALNYGRNLARTFCADLSVIHIAEDVSATAAVEFLAPVLGEMQKKVENVAERVARLASCPVLTVRPNEHEFILPEPVTLATRM